MRVVTGPEPEQAAKPEKRRAKKQPAAEQEAEPEQAAKPQKPKAKEQPAAEQQQAEPEQAAKPKPRSQKKRRAIRRLTRTARRPRRKVARVRSFVRIAYGG
ncbi:hypothetical protein EOA75_27860 [Mesorhizobium sp. M1A.F.Ca.IN.022.07.1.1]|uniref:hypothetical protein n=1 Tax=Mesorhizobium sp. M1A.F.Ca.IN.022.07.1.1 TaxID=2496767 RepID=UPI000FCA1FD8|nr:hypothetical protein [Mesorhizobium sp. M1A.F.Ca.IN.022.07.1.1]RUV84922.1 hypothetical protein EOA75_27860 [Mesorhizobium sp. M1A.F.Ca.IN.022.07.1.1]TIS71580.1 MAG: hypothetical protein E5X11_00605 [Mesorhizobium sp.]